MWIKSVGVGLVLVTALLMGGLSGGWMPSAVLAEKGNPPVPAAAPDTGTTPQDGPAGPAASYFARGSHVEQFAVHGRSDAISTNSVAWVDTGYYQYITTLANERALVNARFAAESVCYRVAAIAAGNWCRLRMLISASGAGPFEMSPPVGTEFAFDSDNNGGEGPYSWESRSIDRHYVVPARSVATAWYVRVYYGVTNAALYFGIDDGQLTVEKVHMP